MGDAADTPFSIPAKIANVFNVYWDEGQVRIVFGDQFRENAPIVNHSHVALSPQNADALIHVLQTVKAQHEAKTATKQ